MSEHLLVEIDDSLLPDGVSGACFDPVVLRGAAEARCRHPFDHEMVVKAWVVLHLLNAWEAGHAEKTLRREWAFNHPCSAALYSDDGELSCGGCMADFRRMDFDELEAHVKRLRLEAGARAATALSASSIPKEDAE